MLVLKTNIAMPVNLITGGSSNVCDLVDEILWETAEAESIQPGFAKAECALSIVAKYIDDCFCATAAESDLSTKNRALLHPQHGKRQTKLEDEVRPDSDSARQTLIKALHLTPAEGTSQEAFISVAGSQVDLTSATLTGRDREYRDATLKAFRGCSDKLKAGTLTKEDLDEAFL
ncbi:hypothetical protein DOTSEDRAFT_48659 [Dothistroma septosporum NZE10]|uniref:Uncharacterized protein n=1 Tax=Dothistroma septosporum (strain NZE10 / CBS 128990) TaxID=675120 RepID=N1PBK2_DOTSN|nr:hypothetical protein DOTSEDRAFT_48659 [Dothistroma septosporum NZE10]